MEEFLKKFVQRVKVDAAGSSFRTLNTGGFHFGNAPAGTNPPFTTYNVPGGMVDGTMLTRLEMPTITVSFWEALRKAKSVYSLRDSFVSLMDRQESTMDLSGDGLFLSSFKVITSGVFVKDPDGQYVALHVDFQASFG